MLILITYDVETINKAGRKRLRQVAKQCVNFGQRVQNSVFECLLDTGQLAELKHRLLNIINGEKDSLRIYYLGNPRNRRVEQFGKQTTYDPEDSLII